MSPEQMYQAILLIAPNFRIGVEYPALGRSLIWRGKPAGTAVELSAGLLFPPGSAFEPRYTALLQQALLQLQQAVG